MTKIFSGVMPAIFSVYDKDRNVIKETVNRIVEYQLNNGMSGFYVGGNTGECTVLPNKTRKQMLEAVKEANKGRGNVIEHVGAGHIDDVYELIDHANEVGVDAIASLPPSLSAYYEMDEVLEYYKILAKRSKAPVFAYVTGVLHGDLVDFAEKVSKIDNIQGIKMSVSDYFTFGRIKAIDNGRLNLLNGPDETMICGLMEGADGAISDEFEFHKEHIDIHYLIYGEEKIVFSNEIKYDRFNYDNENDGGIVKTNSNGAIQYKKGQAVIVFADTLHMAGYAVNKKEKIKKAIIKIKI